MAITRNCEICGGEFSVAYPSKKQSTCDRICGAQLGLRTRTPRKIHVTKICEVCGAEFSVVPFMAKRQRACGKKCGGVLRRVAKIVVTCKQCATNFLAYASEHKIFCSRKCRYAFNRESNHPSWVEARTRQCINCDAPFEGNVGWRKNSKFCSYDCCVAWKRLYGNGDKYPIGSVIEDADGYRRIKVSVGKRNNWAAEHRVVAEKNLGRGLLPSEIVHHVNGIHGDNRPDNLRVMTRQEHMRLHAEAEEIGLAVMAANEWLPAVEGMGC